MHTTHQCLCGLPAPPLYTQGRDSDGDSVPGWPWAGTAAREQSPASTVACCWAPLVNPGHVEQQQ